MFDESKLYYPTIDELELDEEIGLKSVSIVETPAIDVEFLKFNKQDIIEVHLSEDKMIVTGPALIPDKPIYRWSKDRGDFWIAFNEKTIRDIVLKFFKDKNINTINHEHNPEYIKGTMIESWFTKQDNELGLETPKGSWYVSYQIEDKNYWNEYIKTGKVKGFSIEGKLKMITSSEMDAELSQDDILLNSIKQIVLDNDADDIINFLSRNDVGVRTTDLDLSNVEYEDISDNDYEYLTLDIPEVFYYYDKKPNADITGGGLIDDRSRDFCVSVVKQGKYFTAQEIVNLSKQLGYSVFSYAGSYGCRHRWVKAKNFKFLPKK